jgi:hypothetical protein
MKACSLSALVVLAIAGCGHAAAHSTPPSPPPSTPPATYRTHGLAVRLPAGWQHARSNLTPNLGDPRQALAVGTGPLRYRPTGCAQVPGSALEDLGRRDAFVTLEERGIDRASAWTDFPRRPAHFGARLGGRSEASACVPKAHFTDHWFGFTDRGRHFHVLVAFGPRASTATRQQAWTILDSLAVDPRARPHWTSAG